MTTGHLLSVEGVGLRAETAGSGVRVVEVAAESGSQERVEDNLGTPGPLSVPGEDVGIKVKTYLKAGRDSHSRKTNLKV